MDRSIFGSAIKTYPGKNKRSSRYYYRPSSHILQKTNVFDDDDEPDDIFDKLVNEEKTKQTFSDFSTNKTSSSFFGSFANRDSSFCLPKRSSILQNIQNFEIKRSSQLLTRNKIGNSNIAADGKENGIRYSELISHEDDSDSGKLLNPASYDFSPENIFRPTKKLKKKAGRKSLKSQNQKNLKKEKIKKLQYYRVMRFGDREVSSMKFRKAANTPFRSKKNNDQISDLSTTERMNDTCFANLSNEVDNYNTKLNDPHLPMVNENSNKFLFAPLLEYVRNSYSESLKVLNTCENIKESKFNSSIELSCCDEHKNYNSKYQCSDCDLNCNTSILKADENTSTNRFSVVMAKLDVRKSCLFNPAIMSTPERKNKENVSSSPTENENDSNKKKNCHETEKIADGNIGVLNEIVNTYTRTKEIINGMSSKKELRNTECNWNKDCCVHDESFQTEIPHSLPKLEQGCETNQRVKTFHDKPAASMFNITESLTQDLDVSVDNQTGNVQTVVEADLPDFPSFSSTYSRKSNQKEDSINLQQNVSDPALSVYDAGIHLVDDKSYSFRNSLEFSNQTAMETCVSVKRSISINELESLTNDIKSVLHITESDGNDVLQLQNGTPTASANVSFSSLYLNYSSDSSECLGFTSACITEAALRKQQVESFYYHPFGEDSKANFEFGNSTSENFQTVILHVSPVSLKSYKNIDRNYGLDFTSDSGCNLQKDDYSSEHNTCMDQATVLNHKPTSKSHFSDADNDLQYIENNNDANLCNSFNNSFSKSVMFENVNDSNEITPNRRHFDCNEVNSISKSTSFFSPLQLTFKLEDISPIQNLRNSKSVFKFDDTSLFKNEKNRRRTVKLDDISPIQIETSLNVSCKEKRIDDLHSTNLRFKKLRNFEPIREENLEEDCASKSSPNMESTREVEFTFINPNLTTRRRKQCTLPTLNELDVEAETEISVFNGVFDSPDYLSENRQSVSTVNNKSILHKSFILKKGKKWRRSFIALKNIRDYGLNMELLDEDNKGRLWRKNLENLISDQSDAKIINQELEECSTLKTGFDGTVAAGFDEGDTVTVKCGRPKKARFSLCMNVVNVIGGNSASNNDEDSRYENPDTSCTSFLEELRETFVENQHENRAGDYSRILNFPLIDDITQSAKDILLFYCQQSEPLPFQTCFPNSVLKKCEKIGEGVYGEVFKLRNRVLKIIPIEGDQIVNGERQKKFDEILSELVISVQLSNLRKRKDFYTECFAEVLHCWCVYGRYPKRLLDLWKKYDVEKGSDNDSPKMFNDDQLYLILELNDGGKDVESFKFRNPQEALSVFYQVSNALAVAESAFNFEHRDLHWGNILVTRVTPKESKTSFIIQDEMKTFALQGVKVTIIDYTLSRISIGSRTLYNNIGQDPELFTAQGDFQFEVYRLMKKEVHDMWDQFVPKTNVLWLFYLVDKLIHEAQYSRYSKRKYEPYFEQLQELCDVIITCESSYQLTRQLREA